MAQYWEDWSGHTLGNAPSGWTKRWNPTFADCVVQADPLGPAGRRMRINKITSGRFMLSWDAIDADPDRATVKIRALVTACPTTTVSTNHMGVIARGSGADNSSASSYGASLYQSGASSETRRISFQKYLSGAYSAPHSGVAASYTVGEQYWLGLEVNGTTVRYTLAAKDTPDVLIDDQTTTDTSISAAGWVGLFGHPVTTNPFDFLAVGVGTNGDEAPVSALGGAILQGGALASGLASGDLTTAGPEPVKGISLTLHSGQTAQANLTGITACWWDTADPSAFAAPDFSTTSASTDASGRLVLNLDASTALAIGGIGFLLLYKAGASATDDAIFAGRLAVSDIS